MNNTDLYSIVSSYRRAIERARDDRKFERKDVLNSFPNGCCEYASILLSEYLLRLGYDCSIAHGTYYYSIEEDGKEYGTSRDHEWIVMGDETIIDITCDQFNREKIFGFYNDVYMGEEAKVHKMFKDEYKLEMPGFDENWPLNYSTMMKRLYDVVFDYLPR